MYILRFATTAYTLGAMFYFGDVKQIAFDAEKAPYMRFVNFRDWRDFSVSQKCRGTRQIQGRAWGEFLARSEPFPLVGQATLECPERQSKSMGHFFQQGGIDDGVVRLCADMTLLTV